MEYNKNKTNSWKKSGIKPKDIPIEKFKRVCNESESMAQACAVLGLHFGTFKKYAEKYGCYKPNQSGKGINKNIPWHKKLHEYKSRAGIRKRIIDDNLIEYKCQECGLKDSWNNKMLVLHLDHINGISNDHRLENLRWLCPNCHSQTDTYTGKNSYKS